MSVTAAVNLRTEDGENTNTRDLTLVSNGHNCMSKNQAHVGILHEKFNCTREYPREFSFTSPGVCVYET